MAWDYTLNIKQYLNQEGDVPITDIAENVAKELKAVPVYIFGSLPEKLVNETRKAAQLNNDGLVDKDYIEYQFNKVLTQIYDQADEYRVWLGL